MRCFNLHSTENMFCFVNNNIGFPWAIYHQTKSVFVFFVAKIRRNQLHSIKSIFWFVCRKIVSLPALLHLKKVFFAVCSESPWFFTSFYSKQRFYLCLGKWRQFRILFLGTTLTSVLVTKLHFWCSILLEKCFVLLATKLDYLWAVYQKNQRFCLSVFKRRCV